MADPKEARWATDCWSKSGIAHLFNFADEKSHELKAACGHRRVLLNELQLTDGRRCVRCLAKAEK